MLKNCNDITLQFLTMTSFQNFSNIYHLNEVLPSSYLFMNYCFLGLFIMAKHCPNCQSRQITKRHYGKKAGGMLGAAAGASTGAATASGGAQIGSTIGMAAGPLGSAVGGVAGAVIGGLFGAVAGGTVGSKAGEFVDKKILDNYECLNCGYVFSKKRK